MQRRTVWLWLSLALALTAGVARATVVPDAALEALFPRPPADIAQRVSADLDGDGVGELGVLYDTVLTPRYRVGVVLFQQGRPVLPNACLKVPLAEVALELAARDVTGNGRTTLVVTGYGSGGGTVYQLYALEHGVLATVLSLQTSLAEPVWEVDLDDDGNRELVARDGEVRWSAPGGELVEWQLTPYSLTPDGFSSGGWRVPATPAAAELTRRLLAEVAAHRWDRAVETAAEAVRAEPGPAARWNHRLVAEYRRLYDRQALAWRAVTSPDDRFAGAYAAALAGRFSDAGDLLAPFGGSSLLPAGGLAALGALPPLLAAAAEADPVALASAGAQLLRAAAELGAGRRADAQARLARTVARWPQRAELRRWAGLDEPADRLYYVGADELAYAVDLSRDGRLLGPPQLLAHLGAVRSLAGSPTHPAVAYVPAAGRQVLYVVGDGPSRVLLSADFLYLFPRSVSPDGRFVAVDSGTSAVRQLSLVETGTGLLRGGLEYAGRFAWSPDSRQVAVELPRAVEPPLPWADGGTRDVALVELSGQLLKRVAEGNHETVWGLESWPAPSSLYLVRTRLARGPGAFDEARPIELQRFVSDPATGRRLAAGAQSRHESDDGLVLRRLGLPASDYQLADDAEHPRFIVYRRRVGDGAELYLLARDRAAEPLRVGPVPGLEQALVVSWGAGPGRVR